MKFLFTTTVLISSAIAHGGLQSDRLADQGQDKLWDDRDRNPKLYNKQCNERIVARRQEWYSI